MKAPLFVFCGAACIFASFARCEQPLPAEPAAQVQAMKAAKESLDRGDFQGAEKMYESLVAAMPDSLLVLSNLGVVRFRVGKLDLAAKALEHAVIIAPNDSYTYGTLGVIYLQQARYEDAAEALTRAIALDPDNAGARYGLSVANSRRMATGQRKGVDLLTADSTHDAKGNLMVILPDKTPFDADAPARKRYLDAYVEGFRSGYAGRLVVREVTSAPLLPGEVEGWSAGQWTGYRAHQKEDLPSAYKAN
jgi:tetratricopeptide (TPR) repeat protein